MSQNLDLFSFSVNKQAGRPSVVFTPSYFKSTYKYFRDGNYAQLIEMMRQSEIDSYVAGCLKGRRSGFKRDWTVRPASDEAVDVDRAAWIDSVLRRLRWRDLFEDIQEPLLMIFKVLDFDWEVVEGKQVVIDHIGIDQKYFRVDPADSMLKIDQGKSLADIPDTALTCWYKKTPDMLPVTRDFILKNFGMESWAAFLETFGEPFLIGKYPPGCDKSVKDELQAGLDAMARSSRGIMPDGNTVEIVQTTRNTADHRDFAEVCNKGIAISLLGHANAVEQATGLQVGQNTTGSGFESRKSVAEDDMYWIDQHVGRLIKILVDRNFGDGRYPAFEIIKKDPPGSREAMEAIDMAYRHGIELPPENYTRLGIKLSENQGPVKKEPSPLGY